MAPRAPEKGWGPMTYELRGIRGAEEVSFRRGTPKAAFTTLRRLTMLGWQVSMTRDGVPVVDAPSSERRLQAILQDGGSLLAQHYAEVPPSQRPTIPAPYVSCAEEMKAGWAGREPVEFPRSEKGTRWSPSEDKPTIPCPPMTSSELVSGSGR